MRSGSPNWHLMISGRTCARLCHASGGELEQIQFLLGHVSVQTTERYLGCKQRIQSAVNDRIGIELQL
jgi:integrase